nr:hypothetical protein [Phyllobacterium sophorae]
MDCVSVAIFEADALDRAVSQNFQHFRVGRADLLYLVSQGVAITHVDDHRHFDALHQRFDRLTSVFPSSTQSRLEVWLVDLKNVGTSVLKREQLLMERFCNCDYQSFFIAIGMIADLTGKRYRTHKVCLYRATCVSLCEFELVDG